MAGITADVNLSVDPSTGWTPDNLQTNYTRGYSQMTPFITGMADTSGGYDAWLQLMGRWKPTNTPSVTWSRSIPDRAATRDC